MTQFEYFKNMTLEELADWLDRYGIFEGSPWMQWWAENFCDNCDPVEGTYPDSNRIMEFSWCELEHKCKFFQDMDDAPNNKDIIRLWLKTTMQE